jgi:rhamnosyltransferase
MSKILGVVSAYYPDIQELVKNINSYLDQLDLLIIWENTPVLESRMDEILPLINSDKIMVSSTGFNEGLGKPFSEALKKAKSENFDFLLTMDQDSYFANGEFEKYVKLIENNIHTNIAVYSPNRNNIYNSEKDFVEIRTAISSGSIYPVLNFEKTGNFREDYFLYMIDIEYCFRAKRNNLITVCLPAVSLLHKEGYAEKSKFGLSVNNYPAQSTYYIIRNSLLTWKLYPEYTTRKDKIYFYKYKVIYRLLKIMFEKQPFLKIKALILGLLHGFKFKTGQFDLS